MNLECHICGNIAGNKLYQVKEMMFGTREIFDYVQCRECECLFIATTPHNLENYYPKNYYSLTAIKNNSLFLDFIEDIFRNIRAKHILKKSNFLGKVLINYFPPGFIYKWLKLCNVNFQDRILDIGCGKGVIVKSLYKDGFKKIIGADPYIEEDISYHGHKLVFKKDIFSINEEFDFIMMHHSLEHIDRQVEVFAKLNNLLAKNGTLLIRIPTVSSYAWRKFGVNWANLDAPRHLYLHSLKSIEIIANKSFLRIKDIIFDSDISGICNSIQYQKDISLFSNFSYAQKRRSNIFSEIDIKEAKIKTKFLNKEKDGDQVGIVFNKL